MPPPYPPRPGDLPLERVTSLAYDHLMSGTRVYLRWTCPSCGERAISDDELRLVPLPLHAPRVNPTDTHAVGIHMRYLHSVKADGSPCMISVKAQDHLFGMTLMIGNDIDFVTAEDV